MKKMMRLLTAIGPFLLAGCGGQATLPVESVEMVISEDQDIVGMWRAVGGSFHYLFREDGTLHLSDIRDEVEDDPVVAEEYWFEDRQLFVTESSARDQRGSLVTCGGAIGVYEAQLLEGGTLRFLLIEDKCQARTQRMYGSTDEGLVRYERVP